MVDFMSVYYCMDGTLCGMKSLSIYIYFDIDDMTYPEFMTPHSRSRRLATERS